MNLGIRAVISESRSVLYFRRRLLYNYDIYYRDLEDGFVAREERYDVPNLPFIQEPAFDFASLSRQRLSKSGKTTFYLGEVTIGNRQSADGGH